MGIGQPQVGIGIVGCGGFGLFALQQFAQLPGVKLIGLAETYREAAQAAARRFGLPEPMPLDALLQQAKVDLVYISTPPFLHYPQGMAALRAGKHVIVEKPLALKPAQADEMLALAAERNLLLVTDLMQRYNPVYNSITGLNQRKPLGDLLHAYFENYASDEGLPPEHWFWDRQKSGGIFIEHGVHFFDMFAGWLGPGRVESAQVCCRPGTTIEDQALCTARYGDVLVNFYHGFTQPGRLDRQELRLLFEHGDVRLSEWVPVNAQIHALVDEAETRVLCDLFPGARLDVTTYYAGKDRLCSGRHKKLDVYQLIEMSYGLGDLKMHRYGELLRAMLTDQLAWLEDHRHVRKMTEENGRQSLAMAFTADGLARAPAL